MEISSSKHLWNKLSKDARIIIKTVRPSLNSSQILSIDGICELLRWRFKKVLDACYDLESRGFGVVITKGNDIQFNFNITQISDIMML